MSSPTITAVIPTFRRAVVLPRAIESVLGQTYPHLRVLVCDNASDDDTESVVGEYARRDDRVRYHRHPENIGMYRNFQFGVDAVETEHFVLLSDDDLLLPGLFRRAVDAFRRHPDAKFYCGQTVMYDEQERTHGLRPRRHWEPGFHEAGRWAAKMYEHFPIWTASVFSTEVRDGVGPFAPIPMMDVVFLAHAAAMFPFVLEYEPGAVFIHGSRNASQGHSADEFRRCRRAMHDAADALPGVDDAERATIHRRVDDTIGVHAHGLLRQALAAGDRARFEELLPVVETWDGFTARRRIRAAVARTGGIGFRLVGGVTRLTEGHGRNRRSGGERMPLDAIIARYAGADAPATTPVAASCG